MWRAWLERPPLPAASWATLGRVFVPSIRCDCPLDVQQSSSSSYEFDELQNNKKTYKPQARHNNSPLLKQTPILLHDTFDKCVLLNSNSRDAPTLQSFRGHTDQKLAMVPNLVDTTTTTTVGEGQDSLALAPVQPTNSNNIYQRTSFATALSVSPTPALSSFTIPILSSTAFELRSNLGAGGFGSVFKVHSLLDHRTYALKRVLLKSENDTEVLEEACCHAEVSGHPNICSYRVSWTEPCVHSLAMTWKAADDSDLSSSSWSSESSSTASENALIHNNPSSLSSSSVSFSSTSSYDTSCSHTSSSSSASSSDVSTSSSSLSTATTSTTHSSTLSASSASSTACNNKSSVLLILMDLCNGVTLRDWMATTHAAATGDSRIQQCVRIFHQMLSAVDHIHSQGWVHGDLAPANVFVSDGPNPHITILDFGLARRLPSHRTDTHMEVSQRKAKAGSWLYAPPELRAAEALEYAIDASTSSDVFSLGVLLFEMLRGPFQTTMERVSVLEQLQAGLSSSVDADVLPLFDNSCGGSTGVQAAETRSELLRMAARMTSPDPLCRPSCSDLLQSPLFSML